MENTNTQQIIFYYRSTLIRMLENHSQFACNVVGMLLDHHQVEPHFQEVELLKLMRQNICMRYPHFMNTSYQDIAISVFKKLTICLNSIYYSLKPVRIDLDKIFLIKKYNKDVQVIGLFSSTNVMEDAFFIETQDFYQTIQEVQAGFYDQFFFPALNTSFEDK